jgi:FxsC-like protein
MHGTADQDRRPQAAIGPPGRTPAGGRNYYFYLSYAPSRPLPAARRIEVSADIWVRRFFDDLQSRVQDKARSRTQAIGYADFLDPRRPAGPVAVPTPLGLAEVLVPLYSVSYLESTQSLREQATFRERMARAPHTGPPGDHIQPVLWKDLTTHLLAEYDRAPATAQTVAPYREFGLAALSRNNLHAEVYAEVLDLLAAKIVSVAEGCPLVAAPVLELVDVPEPPRREKPFVVAAFAPTVADLPERRRKDPYGTRATMWRPFGAGPDPSPFEAVAAEARRLLLPAEIMDLAAGLIALDRCPGVVLVDPWILAGSTSAATLAATIAGLPPWVVVLVVVDETDPQYGTVAPYEAEVIERLSDSPHTVTKVFRSPAEFRRHVRSTVTQARRRFIDLAPAFPPKGPHIEKPSLGEPDLPTRSEPEEEQ